MHQTKSKHPTHRCTELSSLLVEHSIREKKKREEEAVEKIERAM